MVLVTVICHANQSGIDSFTGKVTLGFCCSNSIYIREQRSFLTTFLKSHRSRRTNGDVLELSEISLDLNLIDNAIRYKFTDAPILAVSIDEYNDNIVILVTTVSSLHLLKFTHPREFSKSLDELQSCSVFHGVCTGQTVREPTASLYFVINQISASSKLIPVCSQFSLI